MQRPHDDWRQARVNLQNASLALNPPGRSSSAGSNHLYTPTHSGDPARITLISDGAGVSSSSSFIIPIADYHCPIIKAASLSRQGAGAGNHSSRGKDYLRVTARGDDRRHLQTDMVVVLALVLLP